MSKKSSIKSGSMDEFKSSKKSPDVFVSTRVVDKTAFEEFAGSLRELIESADEQGTTLRRSVGDVKDLSEGVRKATAELQKRLDAASKLAPSLLRMIERAESLAQEPVDKARVTKELERLTEGEIRRAADGARAAAESSVQVLRKMTSKIEEAGARIASSTDEAAIDRAIQAVVDRQMERVQERVIARLDRELTRRVAQAEAVADRLTELTDSALARADHAEGRLLAAETELSMKAATIAHASAERFAMAEDRLWASERRAEAAAVRAGDLTSLGARCAATAETAVARATSTLCEAVTAAEARVSSAAEQIDTILDSLMPNIEARLEDASERAGTLAQIPGELDRASDSAQTAARDLASLCEQGMHARGQLAQEVLEASAKVDTLVEAARSAADAHGDARLALELVTQTGELARVRLAEVRELQTLLQPKSDKPRKQPSAVEPKPKNKRAA